MKKLLLFTLMLAFITSYNSFAQSDGERLPKKTFVISPLNLIDPTISSLELGFQKELANKLIFQIEGGLLFTPVANLNDGDEYKGLRVRGEFKHIIKEFNNKVNIRMYIAEELMYTSVETKRDYYRSIFLSGTRKFSAISNEVRVNAKFGVQFIFKKHFLLELFTGIGTGIKNIKQDGSYYSNNNIIFKNDLELVDGSYLMLYFPKNIKIGYRF